MIRAQLLARYQEPVLDRLAAAVALAERIDAADDPLLRELDRQRLAWRGQPATA